MQEEGTNNCLSSTSFDSPTVPAEAPTISMGLATLPRSAPPWEELPQDPVPRPSECAVSSRSPVEEPQARTIPTPPFPPSTPPRTRTPAPTLTASVARMSAN